MGGQVTLPPDPAAQPFLTLKGAELSRVYVPGLPAEQCETDTDADGFPDDQDNCPNTPNDQGDVNGDGIGDVCEPDDGDGDGWPSAEDNCSAISNPDQLDFDSDSHGDACDNCVFVVNPGQEDADSNGVGDVCEPFTGPDVPALPWVARLLLLGLLLIGGGVFLRRSKSGRGAAA